MACSRPDPDDILRGLKEARRAPDSALAMGDEQYLNDLLKLVRGGAPAAIVVQTPSGQKKYMLSNLKRLEAVEMLADVIKGITTKERGEQT